MPLHFVAYSNMQSAYCHDILLEYTYTLTHLRGQVKSYSKRGRVHKMRTSGNNMSSFYTPDNLPLIRTNSVKALKEIQSTNANQKRSPTGFIHTLKHRFPGLSKTKFQGFPALHKLSFKDFPGYIY